MKIHSLRLLALALSTVSFVSAQTVDDTQLKQVIILGRHSVRAPVAPNSLLDQFSVQPYPDFGVGSGILTPRGEKLETILGGYYRQWLTHENLLTGNDAADAAYVYFRASVLQRHIDTAQHFAMGLLPAATVSVTSFGPNLVDPLFNPVAAGVSVLDPQTAVAAVLGRLGNNPQALATVYAPELALVHSLLSQYPGRQGLLPANREPAVDITRVPLAVTVGTSGSTVNLGGLADVAAAVDPFLMEYADGMPMSDVGWGQLTTAGINQANRLYALDLDLQCRTPYLDRVLSSNLTSHIARSLAQAANGNAIAGALASPATKVIVLIGSDSDLAGVAGLFHLDWDLPGYQTDSCSPGGAIVFQLRQSQSTGAYIVRVSYVAQTLDQLRKLMPLSLNAPPAMAPVFIPGCSISNATFDCPVASFLSLAQQVIDPKSVDTAY